MRKCWKTIIDFEDYQISNFGEVKSFRANTVKGKLRKICFNKNGQAFIRLTIKTKNVVNRQISRLVAQHFLDDWNPKLEVDHIDEDKANNREDNLRMCTGLQNVNFYHNRRKYSSKQRGVSWCKKSKTWVTSMYRKKLFRIGSFDTEVEAISARKYTEINGIKKARQKYKK